MTLVELLVVIAVIAVLTGLAARAFTAVDKGRTMRVATDEVANALSNARQFAIAQNSKTAFVIITDPTLSFRYQTYGILRYTFIKASDSITGGTFLYEAAQPFEDLPNGVYFQADPNVDTPLANPEINVRGHVTSLYRMIEFQPPGNTSTSGEQNLITIGRGSRPGVLLSDTVSPDKSYMIVGTFTGRVRLVAK